MDSKNLQISVAIFVTSVKFVKYKVKAYKKQYGEKIIDNFYTDSKTDFPMVEISKNAFLVKWEKIEKLK